MIGGMGAIITGGLCLAFVLVLSLWQIVMHLRNYAEPMFQRYILRIIFIVPVTTITSYCSLLFPAESIWFDTVRQWYEAWVIYNFTCLLLAYVGGPGAVELKLDGKHIRRSCLMGTCCFSPDMLVVNGRYVRMCKRWTLQFVYAITPLSVLTVVLFEKGLYVEGDWSFTGSYLYITLLYNVSYGIALSALFYFYYGTQELLAPYHPVLKFIVIKGVVFLTFWQGILCSILHGVGVIGSAEDAKALQNFLILLEMVVAAVLMTQAFPYKEYAVAGGRQGLRGGDLRHAVSIHDVVTDTYHSFAPAYHDYVLYSDGAARNAADSGAGSTSAGGASKQVRKSFRARTFLMMGKESSSQLQGQSIDLMKDMEMGVHGGGAAAEGAAPPAGAVPANLSPVAENGDPFACSSDEEGAGRSARRASGMEIASPEGSAEGSGAGGNSGVEALAEGGLAAAKKTWVHIELNDSVEEGSDKAD